MMVFWETLTPVRALTTQLLNQLLNQPVTGVTHKSWSEGLLAGAQRLWMGMIALFIWLWMPKQEVLDLIPIT